MERFDIATSYEMIPYFNEKESGRVVYHYDVQMMLNDIVTECLTTFSDYKGIIKIIKREGFEVKE